MGKYYYNNQAGCVRFTVELKQMLAGLHKPCAFCLGLFVFS